MTVDVADDSPHVVYVLVRVVRLVLVEDLDDPAPRLVSLGLPAPCPTDFDSSVFSHSSSSLRVMLTGSSNSSMTCWSLYLGISLLPGL